jgi:hypothetical protein
MFQIVRLMDEQQSINKKIANQIPVIVQKSVQEQSKKIDWNLFRTAYHLDRSPRSTEIHNSKLGDGQDDFSGLVSSFKLPHNVSQLYAGRDFNHWTFYEELNFKYSSFLSYEDRNPCLRIGDVMRSAFIFSSFSLICQAKLLNLQSSNFNF